MKNITLILLAGAFLTVSCGPARVVQTESYEPAPPPAPVATVSYQSFYDGLAPYGAWINYPGYGYVWLPNAGPDFVPYNTNGNWVYTDAGWTWASNYSWGWAPFHYGRWFYEGGYGWMWVPGNEWAPAWVSWRSSNDYYGWAPLGPNVSIDVAMRSYNPPVNYWNFVPRRYMGNPQWHNYYVDRSRNVTIINNTTIINNYSGTNRARYAYAPGPDPNEVRRVSGTNFQPVQIREVNTPGNRVSGNQYDLYRPRIDATPSARANVAERPAPARVQNLRDLRPQTGNNTRPVTQPAQQNPVNNNPRPAAQAPARTPENNIPVPATQPANNPRPVTRQPAVQNPPANNPRPAVQAADRRNPEYNIQRPATTPQPATQPASDSRPPVRNTPVNSNPPAGAKPSETRTIQQRQGNARPVQQRTSTGASTVNRTQTNQQTVRPASPAQQHPGSPVIRRTEEKKVEKPKTRSAN
jgi:hypothetical protein